MKKILISWLCIAWFLLMMLSSAFAAPLTDSQCHYLKVPGAKGYVVRCGGDSAEIKNEPENLTIEVSKGECKIFGQNCFAVSEWKLDRHATGTVGKYQVTFYPADYFAR